jgi:colanic acid biosynthesis protein WcaH
MTGNKKPKFLTDRKLADIIKNAPLVSIDLIIRDRKDRVLLQFRQDRPAKDWWFVPGGRIRKYENLEDVITRISQEEIQKAFSDIKINPNECHLLNIYKHVYEKDNKYIDNTSLADMGGEDTHYVSIAYEYKTDYFDDEIKNNFFKWFTINDLLLEPSVHKYTKEFFTEKHQTPNDSQLYSALMDHYIHYDSQFWSRTQIILVIQGAAFVGAYTTSGTLFSSTIMFCSAVLILLVGLLIHRDINNSRVNEKVMDKIGARLFSYYGPLLPKMRPISLRADPIKGWLSGRYIIYSIIVLLILFDLVLGCLLCSNPTFLKPTEDRKVSVLSKSKPIDIDKVEEDQ